MVGFLNAFGLWIPGGEHPEPTDRFAGGTGSGSGGETGSADPNVAGVDGDAITYVQTDAVTGVFVAMWYFNPISNQWE